MRAADRVCIAGIDEAGHCIRPVTSVKEEGIPQNWLFSEKRLIVRPRAKVEFNLHLVAIEPPHIEDRGFDPNHIVDKGLCSSTEWENILNADSYDEIERAYDGRLQNHRWVRPGAQTKSLITLSKPQIQNIQLTEHSIKPRLTFNDAKGHLFDDCPVNDRALWNFCYSAVKKHKRSREEVASKILRSFQNSDRVYFRLGLARPYRISELHEPRCYLQINGVYTFPDYLRGKSYADF